MSSVRDHGVSAEIDVSPFNQRKSQRPRKVILCIWWDWKGIVYELLPENQTINSVKYCSQLSELKRTIDQKRPELANRKGIVFYQDNPRPHVSLATRHKLLQLDWF